MELSADSVVLAAQHQISCQLDDEAALLNLQTGVYYGLDPMGAFIWNRIKQPTSVRALTDEIVGAYQIERTTVEADVLSFLSDMLSAGLVELKGAGSDLR